MALLDFLKNKEEAEKAKEGKKPASAKSSGGAKPVKKTEKVLVASVRQSSKSEGDQKQKIEPAVAKSSGVARKFSYEAVKQPHISEKATTLSESNQYTFEVLPNYNKQEIRKSVEGIYGVNVLSVNIIKIPAKKRRLGKTEGFRKAYKKAIVTIKEGQKTGWFYDQRNNRARLATYVKNKTKSYIILGKEADMDFNALEKFGEVRKLTQTDIFGY